MGQEMFCVKKYPLIDIVTTCHCRLTGIPNKACSPANNEHTSQARSFRRKKKNCAFSWYGKRAAVHRSSLGRRQKKREHDLAFGTHCSENKKLLLPTRRSYIQIHDTDTRDARPLRQPTDNTLRWHEMHDVNVSMKGDLCTWPDRHNLCVFFFSFFLVAHRFTTSNTLFKRVYCSLGSSGTHEN